MRPAPIDRPCARRGNSTRAARTFRGLRRCGAALVATGATALAATLAALVASAAPAPASPSAKDHDPLAAAIARGFEQIETRHVRLWFDDRARVHPAAVESLEAFVGRTLELLEYPASERARVERGKLDYVLCSDPDDVERLTGRAAEGLTVLDRGVVVTRWLPHLHEVVHLLVHRRLQPRWEWAEPFLQEGLATALGGRHGQSPAVMAAAGKRLLDCQAFDPRLLIGYPSFHALAGSPDRSYAAAAQLCAFLLERGGLDRLLGLYRMLSGSLQEVVLRPPEAVIDQLEGEYDLAWPSLLGEFAAWRQRHTPPRLRAAARPARAPDVTATHDGRGASIWREADGGLVVTLDGGQASPDAVLSWGDLLPPEFRNPLLPGGAGGGRRRFALRMNSESAELCDLALATVLVRYEAGAGLCTDPGDGMYDARAHTITLAIPASVMAAVAPIRSLELVATLRLRPPRSPRRRPGRAELPPRARASRRCAPARRCGGRLAAGNG